jgi:hypothetical protein
MSMKKRVIEVAGLTNWNAIFHELCLYCVKFPELKIYTAGHGFVKCTFLVSYINELFQCMQYCTNDLTLGTVISSNNFQLCSIKLLVL